MNTNEDADRDLFFHVDPRELILEAARRSGLLQEVAEAMWFTLRNPCDSVWCPERLLTDDLTDAFEDLTFSAHTTVEFLYGFVIGDIEPAAGTPEAADFTKFAAQFAIDVN